MFAPFYILYVNSFFIYILLWFLIFGHSDYDSYKKRANKTFAYPRIERRIKESFKLNQSKEWRHILNRKINK